MKENTDIKNVILDKQFSEIKEEPEVKELKKTIIEITRKNPSFNTTDQRIDEIMQ